MLSLTNQDSNIVNKNKVKGTKSVEYSNQYW